MAERVVKVSLRAEIGNYLSGMEQARKKTQETGTEAEQTAAKLEQQKQAFNLVGGALLTAGTLAAAAVGVAVKKWMDFDQAMSAVAAATHETEANMGRLRDAALDAGARTVFSATEAANAIEELGKAGLSTEEILSGGLDGALDLAAAGGLGVADAAGIAAVALKTFNLRGSDMSHVADLLAAGAGKAMGEVTDLSQALAQGGQVAKQTGLSIEETTGTLAAFAAQGLLGSDAGTSFKSMLQRLTPQSAEAKKKMDELGISAYDAQGNFIGMAKFAGVLEKGLQGLTTEQRNSALATIFGSDAVRAASVLYSEGEDGIRDWIKAVDDQGYAAETAEKRLDNLAGDIEQFGGAVETAAIKAGEAADGPLRFLVQAGTDLVAGWADAPAIMQQGALAIGAVTAAVSLASGAFLIGIPKVAEYRAAMQTMGTTTQRVGRALGVVAKAGGAAAGLLFAVSILDKIATSGNQAALGVEQVTSKLNDADLDAPFREGSDSVKSFEDALRLIEQQDFDAVMENIGQSIGGVFGINGIVADARESLESVDAALSAMVNSGDAERAAALFDEYGKRAEAAGVPLDRLRELLPQYQEALAGAKNATGENTEALAAMEGAAADTTGKVGELADAIRGFGSAELDTRQAAREFQDALDALDESVAANGATLDITTAAGRANEAALDGIAQAALTSAAAIAEQTGNEELARQAVQEGRDALIEKLGTFGITGQAAQDYADKLGLIPSNIATVIDLQKDDAQRAIDEFIAYNSTRRIGVHVDGIQGYTGAGGITKADGGIVEYFRRGGIREKHVAQIAPAGAWRVWAEPETGGEAYIPLAASKRARSLEVWAETGSRLGVPGFADGGVVPPVYATDRAGWFGNPASISLTIPVYAAPGMDENALVRKVVRIIEEELR